MYIEITYIILGILLLMLCLKLFWLFGPKFGRYKVGFHKKSREIFEEHYNRKKRKLREIEDSRSFDQRKKKKSYWRFDQKKEELEDYRLFARKNDKIAEIYVERAGIYIKLRQKRKAVDDYTEAIKLVEGENIKYYNKIKY